MKTITTAELLIIITNTAAIQVSTTRAGKALIANPETAELVKSLVGNIVRNVTARVSLELELED